MQVLLHCKISMDTHPCTDNFHPQGSLLLQCNLHWQRRLRLQGSLRITDRLRCQDCLCCQQSLRITEDFVVKIVFVVNKAFVSQKTSLSRLPLLSTKPSYYRRLRCQDCLYIDLIQTKVLYRRFPISPLPIATWRPYS